MPNWDRQIDAWQARRKQQADLAQNLSSLTAPGRMDAVGEPGEATLRPPEPPAPHFIFPPQPPEDLETPASTDTSPDMPEDWRRLSFGERYVKGLQQQAAPFAVALSKLGPVQDVLGAIANRGGLDVWPEDLRNTMREVATEAGQDLEAAPVENWTEAAAAPAATVTGLAADIGLARMLKIPQALGAVGGKVAGPVGRFAGHVTGFGVPRTAASIAAAEPGAPGAGEQLGELAASPGRFIGDIVRTAGQVAKGDIPTDPQEFADWWDRHESGVVGGAMLGAGVLGARGARKRAPKPAERLTVADLKVEKPPPEPTKAPVEAAPKPPPKPRPEQFAKTLDVRDVEKIVPTKKAEPPKEGTPAKQPWEMTRKEFARTQKPPLDKHSTFAEKIARYRRDGNTKISGQATGNMLADKVEAQAKTLHRAEIGVALLKGKPVPAEVLAEYPEVAKPAKPKPVAQEALLQYERGQGYTEPVSPRSKKGKARKLVMAADTRLAELKKEAQVERMGAGKKFAEQTRKEVQAEIKAGKIDPTNMRFIPVDKMPNPVKEAVQAEAKLLLEQTANKDSPQARALAKIVQGVHTDKGGAVENQKHRIFERLLGERDARTTEERYWGVPEPNIHEAAYKYVYGKELGEVVLLTGEAKTATDLIRASGFKPVSAAGAMGLVSDTAGTQAAWDVAGKIKSVTASFKERRAELKAARATLRKRRGGINYARERARDMQQLLERAEKGTESPEAQYRMDRAMVGEYPMQDLPPGQQQWVRPARMLQDRASKQLLQELLLAHGGETKLTKSIRANIGKYLKETLIPKSPVERAKLAITRKLKLKPGQFMFKRDKPAVQIGRSHYKFETEVEARQFMREVTAKPGRPDLPFKGKRLLQQVAEAEDVPPQDLIKAAKKYKPKYVRPFTETERIEMGFSRNPMFRWTQSYLETRQNAETLRAFRGLAKQFVQEPPVDVAAGGSKVIAAWAKKSGLRQIEGKPQMVGVLAGKHVPKHIAAEVQEVTRVHGPWMRTYLSYLYAWKSSKTIWNPPTHMRNTFGNVAFADFAGCAPFNPANYQDYHRAIKGLATRDRHYRRLVKEGVIGGEYYGNEVAQMNTMLEGGEAPSLLVMRMLQKGHEKAGRLYNAEDQLFKLASYHKQLRLGMTPKQATAHVNEWFPNYAEVHRWIRRISRSPFGGPFLAFNEQAIRIGGRAAIKHPVKLMYWLAVPGAITAASKFYLGMDSDEVGLIDAGRNYFEPILPWRNKRGAAETVDLRYMAPLANEWQKIGDYLGGRSGMIDVPFFGQQPPLGAALDLIHNRDLFTGKNIVKDDDPARTKLWKGLRHTLRETAPVPSFAVWGVARFKKAMTGESQEHVLKAIAGVLFGVNLRSPYIRRRDAFNRIKALAEQDPAVANTISRLLGRRIRQMSYKELMRDLERNSRFQGLLDLYNDSYRRATQKPITSRGTLQSIRRGVSESLSG